MARRIKQITVDCLNDGTPWAVRVIYFIPREDPEDVGVTEEVQRVREIVFARLSFSLQGAAQALVDLAPDVVDAAVDDERIRRDEAAAEQVARDAARAALDAQLASEATARAAARAADDALRAGGLP